MPVFDKLYALALTLALTVALVTPGGRWTSSASLPRPIWMR